MKPLYDELSLPISITITDRERIFRWGRTHRSHGRFTFFDNRSAESHFQLRMEVKGFDHESKMSRWNMETPKVWPGVLDSVPEDFKAFATEPAFQCSMDHTAFCIWRGVRDKPLSGILEKSRTLRATTQTAPLGSLRFLMGNPTPTRRGQRITTRLPSARQRTLMRYLTQRHSAIHSGTIALQNGYTWSRQFAIWRATGAYRRHTCRCPAWYSF